MSGKAGELIPSYKSQIFPVAPSTSPSRADPPTWVATVPSQKGLEAMKKCQDIVSKMREESKGEREGKQFTRTLAGVSGTWFVWQFVEVGENGSQKG